MALNVYRRHKRECEAGHSEESRSGEFEERKKGFKRCACVIFASGALHGKFNRKTTGETNWEDASAVVRAWEEAGSWDGKIDPLPALPAATEAPLQKRVTIADAVKVFLTNRESAKIAPATLRKYKTFGKQLATFTNSRGYVMLDQITSGDIDMFYGTWKLGPRAKGKRLGTLRAFFRFCMNRKWLPENPVSSDIKPPIGANQVANKMPFSDDEIKRIIEACDRFSGTSWINMHGKGAWTADDLRDFIWLMLYSGLRISDVCFFDMSRLKGSEVFLRAKKNGGDVFAYIPDWLRDRAERGYSQEAFADRCGVHRTFMGTVERGESNLSFQNISKVTLALGIPLSMLFKCIEAKAESTSAIATSRRTAKPKPRSAPQRS